MTSLHEQDYWNDFRFGVRCMTYPQEEFSTIIASSDPKGIMCIVIKAGGLDLEDVCRDGTLGVNVHVLIDDGLRQAPTWTRRLAHTSATRQTTQVISNDMKTNQSIHFKFWPRSFPPVCCLILVCHEMSRPARALNMLFTHFSDVCTYGSWQGFLG